MRFSQTSLLFLLALLILQTHAIAQIGQTPSIPVIGSPLPVSPNAASLAKYGEIPVGYSTGIPNISIPIYTIKTGSLTLPISLSYHAGGVKVEEVASWVGLGWTLNAGGAIVRQLRGIADEGPGGYLQDYHSINNYLSGNMDVTDQYTFFHNVEQGYNDSQQDIFSYNIGGSSGKFIFDSSGSVVPLEATGNKIQFGTYEGQTNCWKITDMDGIQYLFLAKESSISTSVTNNTLSTTPSSSVVTSWYLSKIISAQGTDSISFLYTLSLTTANVAISQSLSVNSTNAPAACTNLPLSTTYSQTQVTGWRLSSILFKNGAVNFIPSSQARCDYASDFSLSAIKVQSVTGYYNETFQLIQSYLSTTGQGCNTTTPEDNRLFLDSLRFSDSTGQNVGEYQFSYNKSTLLPSRLSFSQDHWGYYNGASNPVYLVPTTYTYVTQGTGTSINTLAAANRDPNPAYTQAGILQSITYPTGGKTVFTYENNTANNYSIGNQNGNVVDVTVGQKEFFISGFSPRTLKLLDTSFTISDEFAGLGGVPASIEINNGGGACSSGPESFGCPVVTLTGPSSFSESVTANMSNLFIPSGAYQLKVDLTTVTDTNIINNFAFAVIWQSAASGIDSLKNNMLAGGLRIKQITEYAGDNTPINIKRYQYLFPDSAYYSSGFLLSFPEYTGSTTIESIVNHGTQLVDCPYVTYSSSSKYPLCSTQSSYVGYKYVQELLGANGEFGMNTYQLVAPDSFGDIYDTKFPYSPAQSRDWKRGMTLQENNYRWNATTSAYELIKQKINTYNYDQLVSYNGLQVGRNTSYTNGAKDPGTYLDYTVSLFETEGGFASSGFDTTRTYDQNNLSNSAQVTNAYTYDNANFLPKSVTSNNSNGEVTTTTINYAPDYTSLTGTDALTEGVEALQNANMIKAPIERYVQKQASTGSNIGVVQSVLTSYKSGNLMPDTVWTSEFTTPSTAFAPLLVSQGSLAKDNSYRPEVIHSKYDASDNIIEQNKIYDVRHDYLWDYNAAYPICEVTNGDSLDIAYTSFEADGSGNWTIPDTTRQRAAAMTGNMSYRLTGSNSITKAGLSSSTTYVVGYWEDSSANTIKVNGGPDTAKITIGSWTYYERQVSSTTSVTVSGTGIIDELRLYPKGSLMTTYTYAPLIGMTSQCDASGKITYYTYDGLGRLKLIKDQYGNILKRYDYEYQTANQ